MDNNLKIHAIKKTDWLLLAIILIIGTFLRLSDGAIETHFRYDEARLSQLALEMAHGENFPLLGIESSAGVPNSPMTVYFLAPFFAISSNPLFVVICVALWNVLGVALLWLIAHRYFGRHVGLISALLYAVSPYAIIYSRAIWAQDYHTPIILMGIVTALLGFFEKRYWAQIVALPLLFIGFQIHFAAWTLLPIYLFFLWSGRKNIYWSALGLSILLAILTMLPFIIGIGQQSLGTSDRVELITAILSDGITFRWYPISQVAQLITGIPSASTEQATGLMALFEIHWLWNFFGILAVMGSLLVFRPIWRKFALILLVWAWITLVAFVPIWTGSGVYLHYFIPSIPAFFVLIALAVAWIVEIIQRIPQQSIARIVQVGLYAFIGFILLSQSITTLNQYQAQEDYTFSAETGQTFTPLHYMLDVREVLADYDDVILLGANPHESNYYVWEPLLYDTASCVRDLLMLDGVIDILPQESFAVVIAPLNPINANYEVPERYQHDNPIVVPLRDGEDPYIIYPFETAPEWIETPMNDVSAPVFDAGIELTGYYLGDTFIRLQWHVLETQGNSYQYFVHFLNEDGEKVGQRDGPHYVGQHWCEGDTLITGTLIGLPQETVSLRVGLYTINDDGGTTPSNLLDAEGQIIGEWVDISLINP